MALGFNDKGKQIIGRIDEIDFIDVNSVASYRISQKVAGQGIVFNSEKEAIKTFLDEVKKDNNFDDLIADIVYQMAFWGRIVLTIDKTKGGKFLFTYATPELLQDVGKIEVKETYAKLMKRKVFGLRIFFITEYWDTMKVERTYTIQDQSGNIVPYDVDKHGELPKELQVPKVEYHNLGFVPIIDMTNKPNRNLITQGLGVGASLQMADEFPVKKLGLHINNTLRQQYKEEIIGKSRVIATGKLTTMGNGLDANILLKDGYIQAKATGENSKPIEIMPSTYDGMKWSETIQAKLNLYFKGRGQSELFPTQNSQTEAETLYSKDGDQMSAKYKRRRITEMLSNLIQKLLVYKGLATDVDGEREFSIELKELVVYNQLQMADFLNNSIQYGLMTRKEAIMTQRDLDDPEVAETIIKEIDKDREAEQERDIQYTTALTEASSDNMGKAGMGQDPDTDKEE